MKPTKHFKNKQCWVCGTSSNLTRAHVIPKYLKPINNKIIPVCIDHHKEIDIRFLFKAQLRDSIVTLEKIINRYEEIKGFQSGVCVDCPCMKGKLLWWGGKKRLGFLKRLVGK